MDLNAYFKSIIEQDTCAVVICDVNHDIIYMNSAADKNYSKYGGTKLVGSSIMNCHNADSREKIERVVNWFKADKKNNIVHTFYNESKNKDVYMVALRDENCNLIGYYEKHEFRDRDMSPFYEM